MAKISYMYVEFTQTVSTPDYASSGCRFGFGATLEPSDNFLNVLHSLINMTKGEVNKQIAQVERRTVESAWQPQVRRG